MGLQVEWGKLGLLLVALLGGFACIITGAVVSSESGPVLVTGGFGLITGVIGYVTGNGRLASKGQESVPAIGVRRPIAVVESDAVSAPMVVTLKPTEPAPSPPQHVPQ